MSLENKMSIASPNGKYRVDIGKVANNSLSLGVNFDPMKHLPFIDLLKDHPFIKMICGILIYTNDTGGYTMYVYDSFDYEIFMNDLVEIMQITLI